jgi:hypothetical protein
MKTKLLRKLRKLNWIIYVPSETEYRIKDNLRGRVVYIKNYDMAIKNRREFILENAHAKYEKYMKIKIIE